MDKINIINSINNKTIKIAAALKEKKYRLQEGKFLVEGINLIKDLPGENIEEIFLRESNFSSFESLCSEKLKENSSIHIHIVADSVFKKLTDTVSSIGIVAVCKKSLEKPLGKGNIAIFDRIRDPGNLGTMLRSTLAFGIKDVILIDCVDIYSPKVIRSSLGAIFHLNLMKIDSLLDIHKLLHDYEIIVLDMKGTNIYEYKTEKTFALVVGSEAEGVSKDIIAVGDSIVSIPMPGAIVESLNAAVSFSIALSFLSSGH